jgi:hypothetical protein
MTRRGIIKALDGTHPVVGRKVALVIYALIVLSSVVIAVETLPSLSERTRIAGCVVAEFTILTVFAIEYVLRLTCSRRPLVYATASGASSTSSPSCPRSCSCSPISRPSGPCGSCGCCASSSS